jgi:hypothetical protein
VANPFKTAPVATLVSIMTALLAVLVYLQSTDLITGKAAAVVGLAVGVLQVLLGLYARQHATPVADPRDNAGRRLVPLGSKPSRVDWSKIENDPETKV